MLPTMHARENGRAEGTAFAVTPAFAGLELAASIPFWQAPSRKCTLIPRE